MRLKDQIITVLTLFFLVGISLTAHAAPGDYNLSLEAILDGGITPQTDFRQGDVLYLHVILDNTANVAGTAFTLTHDNTKLTGPVTNADGLPVDPDEISSSFPFAYSTTKTHRANSSEANKLYLAGAEIDTNTGGGKWGGAEITIFTVKYSVNLTAPLGTHTFGLEQTELFNLDAGYGTDNSNPPNGTYEQGDGDTKDPVPILVGAIDNTDPNWGGDLSDDFPDLTPDLGALPALQINILACLDDDLDNLCNIVETGTGTYNGPNDTGTKPDNDDSDNDGIKDGDEVNTYNTDPNKSDSDGDGIDDKWEIDNGLDPNVSNDGVDTDNDGYSDLVENQNNTDPNTPDNPCAYSGYDLATDSRLPAQCISTNPAAPRAGAGSSFSMDVMYDTSDDNNALTGLSLRIYYDSTKLTWDAFSNVLQTSLTVEDSAASGDTGNDDGDPATDKYLEVTWDDVGSTWPNAALPQRLYTVMFTVNGGLTDGDTSSIRFSATDTAAGYRFASTPAEFEVQSFNCDIDGNGLDDALTDGLLIIRYLFGSRATPLINGVVDPAGTRTTVQEIEAFLDNGVTSLLIDIDGNGIADALTDGLLIIRYMFGSRGAPLLNGVVDPTGTRITVQEIEEYISNQL